MARTVVLVCDKCSSDVGVKEFGLSEAGAVPYEIDLCERCSEPVRDLMTVGRRNAAAGWGIGITSATREPELRTKVHDPEELDRLEEEYRKKHQERDE